MTYWEYGELIISTEGTPGENGEAPSFVGTAVFHAPDGSTEFDDERTVNVLSTIGALGWEAVSRSETKDRQMDPPMVIVTSHYLFKRPKA